MRAVYLVSGPAGVGKSTTSEALVNALTNSAYISGDDVSHIHRNGRQKPWESRSELSLICSNILSLTQNLIRHGADVVIDYVAFPGEALWLKDKLRDLPVNVVYVVLWTDPETLMQRDQLRLPEHRMGQRCRILLKEFEESGVKNKHVLDTSRLNADAVRQIAEEIMNNGNYRL
jgi:gluconate kinase